MLSLERSASEYLLNSQYRMSAGQPEWMRAVDNAVSHRGKAADGPRTIPWNLPLPIPKPSLWDQRPSKGPHLRDPCLTHVASGDREELSKGILDQ